MSNLREKIFLHTINESLNRLRLEMCSKYKQKKENRFFTGGVTYEISSGKLDSGGIHFEISSKIPVEALGNKADTEKYFKLVKKEMGSRDIKPADIKMENIIRSTTINEIKERDYVKCSYHIKEEELFNDKEIEKTLKQASAGKADLSQIKGANTNAGRAVIYATSENMFKIAHSCVTDLIKTNEVAVKKFQ